MTQKLSPFKLSKMMSMYFDGYSQSEIANKLKINQATVSIHVSKFKEMSDEQGIKAAGKEFGVMDQVEALHSLAAELKTEKLTVEEAKVGLKMEKLLQSLGVKQEDHKDIIQACKKMKDGGFVDAAIELNKLEQSTGITYNDVVTQYAGTHEQLEKAQQELQSLNGKLDATKGDLAGIEEQKKLATQELEKHMQQVGVDMERLEKVEDLALALKEGGIPNGELQHYIERQKLLNKAGIDIDTLTLILEKVQVFTAQDNGEELLKMLNEYGGIVGTKQALQAKVQLLGKKAEGLEQQAKLKGKIESEITTLKVEKAGLEANVSELHEQKQILDGIKSEINSRTEEKAQLTQGITQMKEYQDDLAGDIKSLEEKTKDLEERKKERDAVSKELSEINNELAGKKRRMHVFESFMGYVQSSSADQLEKFAKDVPYFVEEVKKGQHSPDLIRSMLINNLTGGILQVLKCNSCQVKFIVDKQSSIDGNYHCPLCGTTHTVTVDKNALTVLKTALFNLKTPKYKIELISHEPGSPEKDGDESK
jgi:hypothetical protein